ncbi:hypothetical protein CYY_005348 [Polysphondylium violaceum]|uniref:Partial AB-hydrolase lipase domain-containing protein n=1 Tax=Polysphondylium violaceum TaxID=133409 RepID=A0A8J4PT96_9MYCE|nr:hypothetical protein CYY_005348 [Polysphondylium violaceum]
MRAWLASKISSSLDSTLISMNETLKTFIEELWQLGVQISNVLIVTILGFFYKQGYQSYWDQKNRIKKKKTYSHKKVNRNKKPSPFAQLLNEQNSSPETIGTSSSSNTSNNNTTSKNNSSNATASTTTKTTNSPNITHYSSGSEGDNSPSLHSTTRQTPTKIRLLHRSSSSVKRSPSLDSASSFLYKYSSSPKHSKKSKRSSYSKEDLVHNYEQITTGLFEDVRTNLLLFFDAMFGWLRSTITSIFNVIGKFRLRSLLFFFISFPFYLPFYICKLLFFPIILISKIGSFFTKIKKVKDISNKLISNKELDIRSVQEIIEQSGYPYEKHHVTTEDGYILLLERIPNKKSKNVLYLQHGIFDNSFAWVANGPAQSLAFAAHDQGYDVFLANLRGNGERLHINQNISTKEYWSFSMNEHAFLDIPAFIQNIRKIKFKELCPNFNLSKSSSGSKVNLNNSSSSTNTPTTTTTTTTTTTSSTNNNNNEKIDLNIVSIAHSMGAAVLLMYIVRNRMLKKPHYLSKSILLSPAGYHKVAPKLVDILAPLINIWLFLYPIHVFRFPSESLKILIAKIYHDVMSNSPTKDLLVYLVSRYLLGGDIKNHPLTTIHNLAYNTFNGTSVKTYRHFWQIRKSRKFESFDYGPKKNMEMYGSKEPIDFLDHYDLIDIPIHFIMGLKDNLIDPANIIKHYSTLKKYHPKYAFLKASKNGHIEFTLGLDDQIRSYILNVLDPVPNLLSSSSTATDNLLPRFESCSESLNTIPSSS